VTLPTLVDLTKIQILSVGDGPLQLGAAVTAFRGQEALTNGQTYTYSIQQGANFETGTGIYDSGAGTLTRVVKVSSYGGASIPLTPNGVCTFTVFASDLRVPGPAGPQGNPGVGTPGTNGQNADYAIAGFAVSAIQANEILTDHVVVRACQFAANFSGSKCSVGTNPAAAFVLGVKKNDVACGTISIDIAGVVTFATTSGVPVMLALGDLVTVTAPATPDATVARLRFTLKGN
jgi:hypothetical protein